MACPHLCILEWVLHLYKQDACLLRVQVTTGEVSQIGQTRLYTSFAPSPDAKFLLVAWLERPYSYTVPCGRFPKRVQLWDRWASCCPVPPIPAQSCPRVAQTCDCQA